MSGTDPTILLNANHGNLSKLLASETSLFSNKGYDASQIFAVDNTARTGPTGTQATFGGTDRFQLRKRGGRIGAMWLRLTITAGVVDAANRAAYVDDLAAAVLRRLTVEYASKTIHSYTGEFLKAYCRLFYHDISREAYNAMGLAGLPPVSFDAMRITLLPSG